MLNDKAENTGGSWEASQGSDTEWDVVQSSK